MIRFRRVAVIDHILVVPPRAFEAGTERRPFHHLLRAFMRRIFVGVFYLGMIAVGLYLSWGILEFGGLGRMAFSGGFLVLFGGYMLWSDFFSSNRL